MLGLLGVDPGVGGQAGQLQPVPGTDSQAGLHQALAGDRHPGGEVEPAAADGLVTLEWNITADHVVQEDAQAPHCQLVSVVTFLDNPLRGRVDMSSWKYLILFLINEYTSGHLWIKMREFRE